MLKAINAILISSRNPERLIQFYKTLGVPLELHNHGGGFHAEAEFGDVHFAIWDGGTDPIASSNVNFSFHVPQLESVYANLLEKGVAFDSAPTALPFGGVVANLRDPDGNRITLMRWKSDRSPAL